MTDSVFKSKILIVKFQVFSCIVPITNHRLIENIDKPKKNSLCGIICERIK